MKEKKSKGLVSHVSKVTIITASQYKILQRIPFGHDMPYCLVPDMSVICIG